jgi:chorismate mutase
MSGDGPREEQVVDRIHQTFQRNELGPPRVRQISADVKTNDKTVIYCKNSY